MNVHHIIQQWIVLAALLLISTGDWSNIGRVNERLERITHSRLTCEQRERFALFQEQITGLGIRSFAHCSFAHLLILLKSNELLYSVYCERFAQIAQDKWVTVRESLRSLKTNEQPWANGSGRSWQMSNHEQFAQVPHDKWTNELFAQKKFA